MRGVALVLGVYVINCGGSASSSSPGGDAGQTPSDVSPNVDGGFRDGIGDTTTDMAGDVPDVGGDADPFQCSTVAPLVLSNPTVTSGTIAAGQSVTMLITLTDTDPNGFVSYPGVVLSSTTAGVSFSSSQAGPPGSYIDGTMSKPITFDVKLDASIPAGTEARLSARAYGWGHAAPDCNGFVLSFTLTTS
jgi:hypothetical protein